MPQANATINVSLSDALPVGNTGLYSALRMMRDLYTTDSIASQYEPFSNPYFTLCNDLLVYMDSTNTSGTFWGYSGSQPIIIIDQADVPLQVACHELGHHIMYKLQGDSGDVATPFDGLSHSPDLLSDSAFALKEGFPSFIRCISTVPEALVHHAQNIETNSWWRGDPSAGYPGDSIDCGEIVEGSVASILYDLYDSSNRPSGRTSAEDDSVNIDDMLEYLFYCVWHYRDSINQTRILPVLTSRLLHNTNAPWAHNATFTGVRDRICAVFADYHYHVPANYCRGSSIIPANMIDDMRNKSMTRRVNDMMDGGGGPCCCSDRNGDVHTTATKEH